MYKPNGEEPMSKQEEMRRRQMIAEKAAERRQEAPTVESLRSAFYAVLYKSSVSAEEKVAISL
jgi:hypothetical protein